MILNLIPCTQCNRPVHVTPSAAKRQSNHFCSRKCFGKSRKGKPFSGTSGSPKRKPVDGKLRCNRCNKDVPVEQFHTRRAGASYAPWCDPCHRRIHRDYQRRWRAEARLTQPAPEPVPPPQPEPPPKRNGGMVSKERQEEDLAADRARLEAWIAATDVQPRVDVWGASSASWGAALGGGF